MASEQTGINKQLSGRKAIYRFLGGAALGTFMVFIPYWFVPLETDFLHLGIAALLILLCGTLSSLLGEKFIESLAQALSDSGL